jgi:peptide/nickel transport system permease protein
MSLGLLRMRTAVRRVVHGLLLLAGVSVLAFAILTAAPGNFYDELKLNPQISPATVATLKAKYGMDRPLPVRYVRWVESALRGEFGYSLSYNCTVGSLLWVRARNTLLLTALATLLGWLIALPWGTLEAMSQGGWIDRIGGALTAFLLATPDVLIGLVLLLLAARTGWFPIGGMASIGTSSVTPFARVEDVAVHLCLPVAALVLAIVPVIARHVRSAMRHALDAPFVEAARSLGISKPRIILRYALPSALNPLISLLGFSIGALLSMSLLIEIVLSWPGLGPLILEAMLSRDVYVVVAAIMLSATFLIAGNLIADFLLYWTDPRVRAV